MMGLVWKDKSMDCGDIYSKGGLKPFQHQYRCFAKLGVAADSAHI